MAISRDSEHVSRINCTFLRLRVIAGDFVQPILTRRSVRNPRKTVDTRLEVGNDQLDSIY